MSAEVAGAQPPPLVPVVPPPHPLSVVRRRTPGRAATGAERDGADEQGRAGGVGQTAGEEVGLDEARLARGFVAGDRACLEEAYRRWAPLVHTLAHRELRRTADAEDVTQQVFVSAWRSRSDYDPGRGSLAGWLVGITRHRLLDHHRRQQRQQRLESTLEDEAAVAFLAPPPSVADAELDRLVLAAEIAQLPDPRGTILRMAFWEGYTYQQVADGLDLPLGTVKSHVRRTLLHLRDRLKEARAWTT
ncbi:RNA polymerase sigma factor [Microlunatus flavus]|uniref:RNA polymerase sigma-70 factor, ECF subfamily n=1 Tax=Microlunatus flavus TaxID=1036181 RepID=A0A1H9N4W2_9ACTN|nr:sigma-70 family RNA polymerase sigma factor [Microlunatus flavus]SER30709.1 RNA polymerase sigma-70 factor, ECF subfamily [Microlunatus flavus]